METFECIKSRRSVRVFLKKEVPEHLIEKMLEAAIHAPSSGNLQNWIFVVVNDASQKKLLAKTALGQSFIEEAPVVIVVCSDQKKMEKYGSRGRDLYSIQNAAAATQNMMLAANALGLGTCWVGAFDEDAVSEIAGLPGHVRPLALIPAGFPGQEPEMHEKCGIERVAYYNKYGRSANEK